MLIRADGKGLGPAERQWWVHQGAAWGPEDYCGAVEGLHVQFVGRRGGGGEEGGGLARVIWELSLSPGGGGVRRREKAGKMGDTVE